MKDIKDQAKDILDDIEALAGELRTLVETAYDQGVEHGINWAKDTVDEWHPRGKGGYG